MEPAGHRREQGQPDWVLYRVDPAAMEPAGHRREQLKSGRCWRPVRSPQWSPPVIGGSSLLISGYRAGRRRPQWSPPVIGGSSRQHRGGGPGGRRAAMEPAGHRREQRASATRPTATWTCRNGARRSSAGAASCAAPCTSWTTGRNGARRSSAGAASILDKWTGADPAAMEPAGHRREQTPVRGVGTVPHGDAAMEPAGHRREQGEYGGPARSRT